MRMNFLRKNKQNIQMYIRVLNHYIISSKNSGKIRISFDGKYRDFIYTGCKRNYIYIYGRQIVSSFYIPSFFSPFNKNFMHFYYFYSTLPYHVDKKHIARSQYQSQFRMIRLNILISLGKQTAMRLLSNFAFPRKKKKKRKKSEIFLRYENIARI